MRYASMVFAAALSCAVGLSAPSAQAYVVTLEQVGNNVVATGSGAIAGLGFLGYRKVRQGTLAARI